jgi:serine/threonine protein kinase
MAKFRSRSEIERLNELAEGGEAKIYDYNLDNVIKLFHKNVNLGTKEKKIKFFISVHNQLPSNVIGPEEEVAINGKLEGYVMKKLVGTEDLHMLIKPKFLASMKFSNKDVLSIMLRFGKDLELLHKKGILVGDISDYNFQIVGKNNYFIDVDSYGVQGKFSPDAYTERFTAPDSYKSNDKIEFSIENEYYNFAVLTFYMLTKIHPFEGTYLPQKKMSTVERMKNRISVLGKYEKDIKVPKMVTTWKWMSPKLQDDFLQIFENGKKFDITPDLEELQNNLKYCSTHDIWYYSKYSECPICNEKAKVKPTRVVQKNVQNTGTAGPKITVIFESADCMYVLSSLQYVNKNNQAVHIPTGKKVDISTGKRIEFSDDGKVVYVIGRTDIETYDANGRCMSVIERMPKTNYIVRDKYLYYVDKGSHVDKIKVTATGNEHTYIEQAYKPLFEITEDEKKFIVSLYPKRMYVNTDTYNFDVDYTGNINEYAIKYDKATHHWLFVYQLSNGKFRTIVFGKNTIKYDDDDINYNATTLSNIEFYNNTIYDPDNGKIIGTNIVRNVAKEFICNVVDESSKLEFTGKGFKIYNSDKIYNFG